MDLSLRSSKPKRPASGTIYFGSTVILSLFVLHSLCLSLPDVMANDSLSATPDSGKERAGSLEIDAQVTDIVNPFQSTCYDWEGSIIPCGFDRQYAERLFDGAIPDPRFMDNQNGTVTDRLTGLIWLKNTGCFKMVDLEGAKQAVQELKDGDCGPDPKLILSDGSSAGDWRLPTMRELCALIDYSRRDPALPPGQPFSDFPPGYFWSATVLDYYPEMAWIVYIESGTTCYEDIKNRAGHIWPVREPRQ